MTDHISMVPKGEKATCAGMIFFYDKTRIKMVSTWSDTCEVGCGDGDIRRMANEHQISIETEYGPTIEPSSMTLDEKG